MNIDSIKNYPTGSIAKHKYTHSNVLEYRQKSADLCEEKSVNRGYYSGSFTGINMNRAAANISAKVSGKSSESTFDKILKLCDKHTVIAQNLVALVLAAGLRPIAILSLPGKKDKEDKIYAAGHSIASGLIGFGFSTIVMYPLGQAVDKTKGKVKDVAKVLQLKDKDVAHLTQEELEDISRIKKKYNVEKLSDLNELKIFKKFKEIYKVENLAELDHSAAFKNVTKIMDMAPDVFVFGVLKAMLTVALIPPILKYGFGLEKKKKTAQQPAEQQAQLAAAAVQPPSMEKPDMTKFAGGLK